MALPQVFFIGDNMTTSAACAPVLLPDDRL
jgi:hypothetical protein